MPASEDQAGDRRPPRVLFCSYHCYLDPSSGAALSARDLFTLLAGQGWQCQVFCGAAQDFEQARPLVDQLRDQNVEFVGRPGTAGPQAWSLLHCRQGGVPVMIYQSPRPQSLPTRNEGVPFLALLERVLDWFQPDLVVTYGGNWLAQASIAAVKRRGLPVVFWLCNLAYPVADFFRAFDGVLVPSEFARAYYHRRLGLDFTAIPCPLDRSWCQAADVDGRYVTFVNPQPAKGVFWFAGLARDLAQARPDIPLLVVEGRGTAAWLSKTGIDPAALPNLRVMANTPDPRTFYAVSRLVLMPSLWQEPFGRVAAEACVNGIPVLASRRGGLPEVLAEAGFLFDVPERYTPDSRLMPTAEETAPWIETIIRLFDDEAFYQTQRQRSLTAAEAWRPERLAARYDAFLRARIPAALADRPLPNSATAGPFDAAAPAEGAEKPEISVIMPVYNAVAFLERALESLRRQTFQNWELVAVDDGSSDDSYARLCRASAADPRIRVLRQSVNRGPSAARNVALGHARADTIAYLDNDDEYYPDYLANVHARHAQADVLVFEYDMVEERPNAAHVGRMITHRPSLVRDRLMAENIMVPLGVAHRRALLERSGLFNEANHFDQDWELWKRFAEVRALFLFVNLKSGLYHIRADSQARTRRVPDAAR